MIQKRLVLGLIILICLLMLVGLAFIFSDRNENAVKDTEAVKSEDTANNGNTVESGNTADNKNVVEKETTATDENSAKTISSNEMGVHDGYNYELWKDRGTTNMTLNSGGAFSCQWSNINNALFRKGKKFDSTQTYKQLGDISVNYAADYQPNGNSYLCVYGWSVSPLVEFYIVDSWGSWRPPGAASIDTITVDGGSYDIYQTTRTNQPSIQGTATFNQYWSVRQSKRTSGTISVSEHFKKWESLGMPLGKMYEVALTVEGYQSSGSADVTSNTLTISGK